MMKKGLSIYDRMALLQISAYLHAISRIKKYEPMLLQNICGYLIQILTRNEIAEDIADDLMDISKRFDKDIPPFDID